MTDIVIVRQRLLDAETALHKLLTGTLEVTVSVGGYGATTYSQTNIAQLRAYIAQLKSEIAKCEGRPRRGPLLIRF